MLPMWVGTWDQKSLSKGPFSTDFLQTRVGLAEIHKQIVSNGYFSNKICHKDEYKGKFW